jgi:hypothetical protein
MQQRKEFGKTQIHPNLKLQQTNQSERLGLVGLKAVKTHYLIQSRKNLRNVESEMIEHG